MLSESTTIAHSIRGVGVRISIGNTVTACIPPEFCGSDWDFDQCETVSALVNWLATNPGAVILDVGCSTGVFAVAALFADPNCEVIAFDSDTASLKATRRVTRFASGNRLRLVRGLVTDRAPDTSLATALAATEEELTRTAEGGAPGTTQYICLNTPEAVGLPVYTLDALLASSALMERPLLLKCDVEGAEAHVLRGARITLQANHPTLLLSVHPPALPTYGSSEAEVRSFLKSARVPDYAHCQ